MLQACANIISHTCLSSNGQSGSSMWDDQNRIRAILTGKVNSPAVPLLSVALVPARHCGAGKQHVIHVDNRVQAICSEPGLIRTVAVAG